MIDFAFDDIKEGYTQVKHKVKVMIAGLCVGAFLIMPNLPLPKEYKFQEYSDSRIEQLERQNPVELNVSVLTLDAEPNKWYDMIDEIANLPENWDEDGAKAVDATTIDDCRQIIRAADGLLDNLCDISPTELGSVCMQWYNKDNNNLLNVEVACHTMAYYLDRPAQEFISVKSQHISSDSIDTLIHSIKLV
ncbi:MAG: hypothetical protein K2G52_03705 [Muribaculaceae bacterium]|nr:hypothetical protein [Muribaculaceae bacterium]